MPTATSPARVDTLLALAITFAPREREARADGAEGRGVVGAPGRASPLTFLSALPEGEMREVTRRFEWYNRLGSDEQERWLAATLGRVRAYSNGSLPVMDDHLHYSHVVEAMRPEPRSIQTLILKYLPAALAQQVASALAIGGQISPAGKWFAEGRPALEESPGGAVEETAAARPDAGIISVIRRSFISRFVSAGMLHNPTRLDLLSGVELARFVYLLGIREVAIACRGNPQIESVASFLGRLPAEDTRAITEYMQALETVDPARGALAERLAYASLSLNVEPPGLIDRIGLTALATAISRREPALLAYTAQKLPVTVAVELLALVEDASTHGEPETVGLLIEEAESMAIGLHRALTTDANFGTSGAGNEAAAA